MTELCGPSILATVALDDRHDGDHSRGGKVTGSVARRTELVVAMPPGQTVEVGQEVTVGLAPSRIHWFSARTGERLSATRPRDGKPE